MLCRCHALAYMLAANELDLADYQLWACLTITLIGIGLYRPIFAQLS